jgi:choline dehydrogenase
MAYSHSTVGAFQLWADTVGDQSYTYENVLPYYRKTMNFTIPDSATRLANATPSYNTGDVTYGGPLQVTYPAYAQSWSTWVAKGLAAIGIAPTDSFITGSLNGSAWQLNTVSHTDGHRSSSEVAYLRPVLNRSNLFLFTETMANRIIFNSQKVAQGVEVACSNTNTTYTLSATKEVIVSAGVFQSPQLLMVSGIGPAAVLEEYDIPVIANLPGVGQGMNDHIFVPLTYPTNLTPQGTVTTEIEDEFNEDATGPLTNPGGDYLALEKIPQAYRANWSAETVEG